MKTRMRRRQQQCFIAFWTLCLEYVLGSGPRVMPWSNKKFGPDGPWQAVTVQIGSNYTEIVVSSSEVALYLGGSWESKILLSSICDNKTLSSVCYGDIAGLFDSDISASLDNTSIEMPPYGTWGDVDWGFTNAAPVYAKARRATDYITISGSPVPDVDMIIIYSGWQTYPGGQAYPLEVGILSLGCPAINQTFGNVIKINTTFVTSYFYEQEGSLNIPSYSYGMHIGSAALGIPGSLLLGGYDQNRVMGEVSSQAFSSGSFPIELLNMNIGVAEGGSPWAYTNKAGLLAQCNSSLDSGLSVIVDPANPYIYLPQSSCDAIAAELPVPYHPEYGLYFWNTSDTQYDTIATSPGYLGFQFSKHNLNNNFITIKVPFALLNLTLEAPLAAFIGVNWLGGKWFLAQAPGPGGSFIVDTVSIGDNDFTISATTNSWEATWKSTWKAIPAGSTSNANTTGTSMSGPSTDGNGFSVAVKIGIIVGSTIGGLSIIAILSGIYIHHRRQQKKASISDESHATEQTDHGSSAHQLMPVEAPDNIWNQVNEIHSQERHEMGSERGPFYELGPEKGALVDLDQRSKSQEGPFELPARTSVSWSSNVI
ncbi:aspartic protease [Aspergillus piperis CBS 112811]|uniref:Aspartic protease n=1 Tax=Aspergillus piperis CBS 112811 TaxID=1448313 RepID=A0A8G1QUG6_9EURO|nr:aspartic protease [Aspergillus piperis CBS 112811]RAH54566.1 aspartic protease [Aspergillus piperis CBS 112811]